MSHPTYPDSSRLVLIGDAVTVTVEQPWEGTVAEIRPCTAYIRSPGGLMAEVEVPRLTPLSEERALAIKVLAEPRHGPRSALDAHVKAVR